MPSDESTALQHISTHTVVVKNLVKKYPKSKANAIDGLDFAVDEGGVFGLLGPNGAGKTSTVGVLTTRIKPTSGTAYVAGVDVARNPAQARRHLAVVPQRSNLDMALSIRQNLLFHARYHGVPVESRTTRSQRLLTQFGLIDRADERPHRLSGGQAQRVMIARAMMHSPTVLFLDEPSSGLDPAARLFLWDQIRELRDSGVTIVLTTHDMVEAATLSDRVGIMDYGKLLALDSPANLTKSVPIDASLELVIAPAEGVDQIDTAVLARELGGLPHIERIGRLETDSNSGQHRVRLIARGGAVQLLVAVSTVVERHGGSLSDAHIATPTLEDVFIHYTGRALR